MGEIREGRGEGVFIDGEWEGYVEEERERDPRQQRHTHKLKPTASLTYKNT